MQFSEVYNNTGGECTPHYLLSTLCIILKVISNVLNLRQAMLYHNHFS